MRKRFKTSPAQEGALNPIVGNPEAIEANGSLLAQDPVTASPAAGTSKADAKDEASDNGIGAAIAKGPVSLAFNDNVFHKFVINNYQVAPQAWEPEALVVAALKAISGLITKSIAVLRKKSLETMSHESLATVTQEILNNVAQEAVSKVNLDNEAKEPSENGPMAAMGNTGQDGLVAEVARAKKPRAAKATAATKPKKGTKAKAPAEPKKPKRGKAKIADPQGGESLSPEALGQLAQDAPEIQGQAAMASEGQGIEAQENLASQEPSEIGPQTALGSMGQEGLVAEVARAKKPRAAKATAAPKPMKATKPKKATKAKPKAKAPAEPKKPKRAKAIIADPQGSESLSPEALSLESLGQQAQEAPEIQGQGPLSQATLASEGQGSETQGGLESRGMEAPVLDVWERTTQDIALEYQAFREAEGQAPGLEGQGSKERVMSVFKAIKQCVASRPGEGLAFAQGLEGAGGESQGNAELLALRESVKSVVEKLVGKNPGGGKDGDTEVSPAELGDGQGQGLKGRDREVGGESSQNPAPGGEIQEAKEPGSKGKSENKDKSEGVRANGEVLHGQGGLHDEDDCFGEDDCYGEYGDNFWGHDSYALTGFFGETMGGGNQWDQQVEHIVVNNHDSHSLGDYLDDFCDQGDLGQEPDSHGGREMPEAKRRRGKGFRSGKAKLMPKNVTRKGGNMMA
ncbi:MAG: hypothetical protein LBU69_02370 [Deltaproteobacteria bacterium]|jgi:hypothetical protein|nr:hypothetical protein [Deltaproteobacteria bacterium]